MSGWRTLGSSVGSGCSTMALRLPVSRSTSSASWRTVNSWGLPMFVGSDPPHIGNRSEEHTSELQSRVDLVCRLLLEKKKYRLRQIVGFGMGMNQRAIQRRVLQHDV